MDENLSPPSELEPIPGDTFPLHADLKPLGAIWDPHGRVWSIAPDKLKMAIALVENQALIPVATTGEIIDPFEEDGKVLPLVALEKRDGATYEAWDALRVVGVRWDKTRRSWMISENRADYARAILSAVTGSQTTPSVPAARAQEQGTSRSKDVEPLSANVFSADSPVHNEASTGILAPSVPSADTRNSMEVTRSEESPQPMVTDRIKLGGLWLNQGKDGREYLSGKLSQSVKILVFRNGFQTNDSQPSHVMYLAPLEQ